MSAAAGANEFYRRLAEDARTRLLTERDLTSVERRELAEVVIWAERQLFHDELLRAPLDDYDPPTGGTRK